MVAKEKKASPLVAIGGRLAAAKAEDKPHRRRRQLSGHQKDMINFYQAIRDPYHYQQRKQSSHPLFQKLAEEIVGMKSKGGKTGPRVSMSKVPGKNPSKNFTNPRRNVNQAISAFSGAKT